MFLIKKIISPFFYPFTICVIFMVWGLLLLWFTKHQKMGKALLSIGVIVTAILSYGAIADSILGSLERIYPPYMMEKTSEHIPLGQNVRWIAVLGGGHISDPALPVTSQISVESLSRLTEGVRIYRSLPRAKLILSGGTVFDPVSDAEIYFKTARIMNIPPEDLIISDQGKDTEEEVLSIKEKIGKDPFILVTSAYHMRRATALFKKQGMNPVPAPAGYLVKVHSGLIPRDFFPSPEGLQKVYLFAHEYLGFLWSKLRNRI